MILTDTHTHLYYETDAEKQSELMKRCHENYVERLFLPNVNVRSIPMVMDLVSRFPENCFPMLGLHPCDVKAEATDEVSAFRDELSAIESALTQHRIYAVGEIGIDLYWDKTTLEIQREAFRTQIQWAKRLGLPIVIHCREAFEEVYEVLLQEKGPDLRGIFHCFTGSLEEAQKVIDLGFYLGIGGVVTYKNSGLDKVVAQLDLKHLVLETDSPYLSPVPFRGKPNESSYLFHVAQKVGDILHKPVEVVAEITTANSRAIFGV
ncbi:MAG TPA: TatD family hydrolase [Sphingobacteriaceae bacterium]